MSTTSPPDPLIPAFIEWRSKEILEKLTALAGGATVGTVTPALSRPTTSGTITGKRSVSFANVGSADGTVGGVTLKAGEQVTFDAPAGAILADLAYNATGTTFLIATLA